MCTIQRQTVSGKSAERIALYNFATDDASPDAVPIAETAGHARGHSDAQPPLPGGRGSGESRDPHGQYGRGVDFWGGFGVLVLALGIRICLGIGRSRTTRTEGEKDKESLQYRIWKVGIFGKYCGKFGIWNWNFGWVNWTYLEGGGSAQPMHSRVVSRNISVI